MKNFLVITLFLLVSTGCSNHKSNQFDSGRVENDKYINTFLGFDITLPQGWFAQTIKQNKLLYEIGKKLVVAKDKNMQAAIDANDSNLLTVYKYNSRTSFNPTILVVVRKKQPKIKTGKDFLYQARLAMKQAEFKYDYIGSNFKKTAINNQDFFIMDTNVIYNDVDVKQKYYAIVKDDYCICVVITYSDYDEKQELLKILNSIKFSR
ncbi:MAG: hypothetical protein GY714_26165 [Desulfobacterales bacterium]|nr:hypothetical protein [Desulfobacterales bacterium]